MLVLDNFGLNMLTDEERHDLLEVVEDRTGRGACIVTSQIPVKKWHAGFFKPAVLPGQWLNRSPPTI